MMTLALESKRRAWWQPYDLAYDTYVGVEADAVAISAFQPSVVNGLLHTADYARDGHEVAMPMLDPHQIDLRIEAKLTRQRFPAQDDPPWFHVALDEAALHREVGGRKVMAAQLAKIVETAALPNVVVQNLPYDDGPHPGVESNFTILELPNPASGVVFVEGLVGSTHLEHPQDIERYQQVFGHLRIFALNPQESIEPSWVRLIFTGGSHESD